MPARLISKSENDIVKTGEIILNILKVLQVAERKLEKEAHHIGVELSKLRNAMFALGHKAAKPKKAKRRLSPKARARIAAAQRARWAKVKTGKKAT
jgi:hypothetical protein